MVQALADSIHGHARICMHHAACTAAHATCRHAPACMHLPSACLSLHACMHVQRHHAYMSLRLPLSHCEAVRVPAIEMRLPLHIHARRHNGAAQIWCQHDCLLAIRHATCTERAWPAASCKHHKAHRLLGMIIAKMLSQIQLDHTASRGITATRAAIAMGHRHIIM